jgi:hypothetical protein
MLYDLDFGTAGTNTLSGPDTNDAPLPGPSNGNWVNLYDRNHGSGQADMRLLVPESYFNGVSNTSYIYFYSRFGDTQVMTGGYEEWYVGPTQREEAVRVVTRIDRELPGGGEQQGPTDGSVFIVPFASTVHDHAFVTAADGSGTPTGQVIYSFWNNPDCAGDPIYTSPPLAIGTQSASQGPLFAGDYSFAARYLGDSNFSPGLSECEPLHVNRGVSGLDYRVTTNIHDADHNVVLSVPLGTTVHDEATVTPALTTYPRPTGTVTFTFYRNAECFGPGEAAGTVTLSVAAANTAIAHPSTAFGPLGAGSYSFFAHYNGDTQYDPGDGPCEPLTVNKADTRTETQVHNASHQDITNTIVLFGTLIHDQATVTNIGPGGGFAITGNVRFDLYDTLNCTGPVSGTWTVAIGSSGAPDGTATPAIPAPSGFHSFCATYLGDGNYNGSTSAPEPFTVLDDQNGKTPGFWQNPVGNPLINEDDLAELRSLCLVNDDGSDFDPTTREQVAAWITSQANENMAYKLSSFLAAMTLNVNHGFNWEGLVYSPQFGNTGPNGDFILLSELLEMVNDELCDHPYTPNDTNDPGNAFRAYQASLKDLLDALCNNQPLFLP